MDQAISIVIVCRLMYQVKGRPTGNDVQTITFGVDEKVLSPFIQVL